MHSVNLSSLLKLHEILTRREEKNKIYVADIYHNSEHAKPKTINEDFRARRYLTVSVSFPLTFNCICTFTEEGLSTLKYQPCVCFIQSYFLLTVSPWKFCLSLCEGGHLDPIHTQGNKGTESYMLHFNLCLPRRRNLLFAQNYVKWCTWITILRLFKNMKKVSR